MRLAILAGVGLLTLGVLRAQVDPPSRVARLNYLSGGVSFQPGGVDDWVEAPLNRPLTSGDHIWADRGAGAELHIGSTAIRVGEGTDFAFLNLDDRGAQIRLAQGSLEIHVRRLEDGESFEVDTPNLAFSLLRPGTYRIDVSPAGDSTLITVRAGEGEGTGGGQAFPVHARQQARVSGLDSISYDLQAAPSPDAWDNWCASRDGREEQAQSARYVSREVIGYEDLDQYGGWREAPEYGMIWYPRTVAAGWAPYHNGHWAWIDPWGWTWVDDAPWGFAPFHYGRWVYAGGWGWVPGPVVARPVYAPALVAWVGGAHFSLSIRAGGGGGGVAWFPLGPGDVYVPAYHTSPRYFTNVNTSNTRVNNVNITRVYNTTIVNNNTTVINNTDIRYVNRNAPGAVTAVPQEAFVRSRPVAQAAVSVPANFRTAPVSYSAQLAPTRQSVLGANAPAPVASRPAPSILNRPVVARAAPPSRPIPFAMKQEALQANPGRPLAPEAVQQLQQRSNANVRPLIRQAPVVRTQPGVVAPGPGPMNSRAPQLANPGGGTPAQAAQPNPRLPQPAAPRVRDNNGVYVRPGNPSLPSEAQPRQNNPLSVPPANPRMPVNAPPRETNQPSVPPAAPRTAQPSPPPSGDPLARPARQPDAPRNYRTEPPVQRERPAAPVRNTEPQRERPIVTERPAPPPVRSAEPQRGRPIVTERPAPPPARSAEPQRERPIVTERPAPPPVRSAEPQRERPPARESAPDKKPEQKPDNR